MGVSKLMDLLVDSREIIRNDVSFIGITDIIILKVFCHQKETLSLAPEI